MSPRTEEQFQTIRDRRKRQIMQSALELFSYEGYAHCTIAKLATHAGISKGLMYNYFESKEALLKEILTEGLEEITAIFDPNHDGILTSEEFAYFIRNTFQLMHEKQEFWMMFIALILQPGVSDHLKDQPITRFMEQYIEMLYHFFNEEGYEDPMLEVLHLSATIEGLGVMMLYSRQYLTIPGEIFQKFEDRIIKTYIKES